MLTLIQLWQFVAKHAPGFLVGSVITFGATIGAMALLNKREQRNRRAQQADTAPAPAEEEREQAAALSDSLATTAATDPGSESLAATLEVPPLAAPAARTPRAEIFISAGPRKTADDTELGEDVAGTVVTPDRIYFWVLDGTSDSATIRDDKGREIFSSRLFAHTIGSALRELSLAYSTAPPLAMAALDQAAAEAHAQVAQHQPDLLRFIAEQPPEALLWDASTTLLLGILHAHGEADLFRIGDSKAICYGPDRQPRRSSIDRKPTSLGLGRLYVRLHRGEDGAAPTAQIYVPEQEAQLHHELVPDVRRVIAFSDGISANTEQYLLLRAGQDDDAQLYVTLPRLPNRTFDDKTLLIASF